MSDEPANDSYRCGGCGRRLQSAWSLCEACQDKLSADLLEIAERYTHLNASRGYEPGRYDKPGSNKPGTKPPGRVDIMALRDFRSGQSDPLVWRAADGKHHREAENDTPAVLRAVLGWCEVIATERGFQHEPWLPAAKTAPRIAPRFTMADHDEMTGYIDWDTAHRYRLALLEQARDRRHRDFAPEQYVDAAVTWLNRQDDWVARWASGPELAEQARKMRNRLRSATGDPNPKPLGFCVRHVTRTDEEKRAELRRRQLNPDECSAAIFAPERAYGDAYTPVVRCTTREFEKHEYSGYDLRLLRLNEENDPRNTDGKPRAAEREAS